MPAGASIRFGALALALPVGVGLALAACGDLTEAPRVELPLVVDGAGVAPVTTDLGYAVEISGLRVALRDVAFTAAGEVRGASLWRRLSDALVPPAAAHPGHHPGADVTGELRGRFIVDWIAQGGRELGRATLIAGDYGAANFTFDRASAAQVSDDDPLLGHTAIVEGEAVRGGERVAFTIVVDAPDGRELVGAPFEASVSAAATGRLMFRFETRDPFEGDTAFDGLDFLALDGDGDGEARIAPEDAATEDAYHAFRRTFSTHDHYTVQHEE